MVVVGACTSSTGGVDEAPALTEFSSYELTYSSTCGDGPFFTEGTTIRVEDGSVTVVGGEQPAEVGSIASWNEKLDEGYRAPDLTVETVVGGSGEPREIRILSGALDRDFCVDVSEFVQKEQG